MKYCNKCRNNKADTEFGVKHSGRVQSWCKTCQNEYNRKWYELNKESHKEYVASKKPRKIHLCKFCGRGEPEVSFYINRQGKRYYRKFICHECDKLYRKRYPSSEEALKRRREIAKSKAKVARADLSISYKFIYRDSRRTDKSKGLENDLTLEFVKNQIENGCLYCGDKTIRMTLDRLNNAKGHTQDNVVPSCIRCNYLKRDMPLLAWTLIVPGVRKAREAGYLNDWHSGMKKNKSNRDVSCEIEDIKIFESIKEFNVFVPESG